MFSKTVDTDERWFTTIDEVDIVPVPNPARTVAKPGTAMYAREIRFKDVAIDR